MRNFEELSQKAYIFTTYRAEGLVVSMESKNSIKYREYLDLLLRWCCWVSITFYLSWCFRNDLSQCDLLIWEDTNYGLSHRLMLISLANNHIWESTYIDSLLTLFLSVCCIFSSFVRKLSFVRFCYESCSRFNFECKTKTHKSQERIELRFPSLCSEEQEVEEKPPGSQEKANCPDDKVRIWTFFACILFWIRLKHH